MKKMESRPSLVQFLPVVDEDNTLVLESDNEFLAQFCGHENEVILLTPMKLLYLRQVAAFLRANLYMPLLMIHMALTQEVKEASAPPLQNLIGKHHWSLWSSQMIMDRLVMLRISYMSRSWWSISQKKSTLPFESGPLSPCRMFSQSSLVSFFQRVTIDRKIVMRDKKSGS